MPKVPMYTLSWLSTTETYELYQTRDRGILGINPGGPEWFAWLEQISSFTFSGKSSHYTARKEAKQRGERYWYAYLATGEHLMKKYLGKTADPSLSRLEQIAEMLSLAQATRVQPGKDKPFQPTQNEFQKPPPGSPEGKAETTNAPLLDQHRTPLHPLLVIKLHVLRPGSCRGGT